MTRKLEDLRSRRWFAAQDMRGFAHRQRMQQMGLRRDDVHVAAVRRALALQAGNSPAR